MILPDEWPRIIAATLAAPRRSNVGPGERALIYRFAVETGLRSSEICKLTRGVFVFDGGDAAHIRVKAPGTKNKKPARQYLSATLAAQVKQHLQSKTPKAAAFSMPEHSNMADMLGDDVADARRIGCTKHVTTKRSV
ncbi:MAG: hypothetical protein AAFN70_05160 [Planctomycetota bacterium]